MVFVLAVFSSAALLFLVEPMFGKMLLPRLGGSPAVWTTCMLFFQGALLLGYLYAHLGPRWLGVRLHAWLHVAVLALCLLTLPIRILPIPGSPAHPTTWLLTVLVSSLAAPFILLSSTGPLLQVWFSRSSHVRTKDPYFLYAASNAGSLLALLSYPFLLEPLIPLSSQARFWSIGYAAVVGLVAIAASNTMQGFSDRQLEAPSGPSISLRTRFRWIALAFVPSSFFLALTTHVTTDIASVPLLWVVPLVLYLLSFSMVFARSEFDPHANLIRWQPIGLIALVILNFWGPSVSSPWVLPLHLIVFFVTALVCHGELAASKPPAGRLTDFYLSIALGGLLGGVFNALIAPVVFNTVLEYSLTLLAASAVRPSPRQPIAFRDRWWGLATMGVPGAVLFLTRRAIGDRPALAAALIGSSLAAILCLRLSRDRVRFTLAIGGVILSGVVVDATRNGVLLRERNFFGVREVQEYRRAHLHVLMHGTTEHGAQSTDPSKRGDPLSYYSRLGPVGDAFRVLAPHRGRSVAVIGLGAGTLAAYARKGDHWVFYEIDPDIAQVARDTNYFTYLRDTPAKVEIVLGDGRLSLAAAPARRYDLLVVDAFNSDAIPIHLLTREALSLYLEKLSDDGIMLFHLSNRYLDLEPVLGRLAQTAHLFAVIREDTKPTRSLVEAGAAPSTWAALSPKAGLLTGLQHDPQWRQLRVSGRVRLWTDDFSNIFSVFRWP